MKSLPEQTMDVRLPFPGTVPLGRWSRLQAALAILDGHQLATPELVKKIESVLASWKEDERARSRNRNDPMCPKCGRQYQTSVRLDLPLRTASIDFACACRHASHVDSPR